MATTDDDAWALFQTFGAGARAAGPRRARCDCVDGGGTAAPLEGVLACARCGVVLDRLIDTHAEWRFYGHEDSRAANPERCGLPTSALMPHLSLASTMGVPRAGESCEVRRIRRYHRWNAMPYRERSLFHVLDAIAVRGNNHGIPPSVVDEAKHLYKRLSEQHLSRGENRHGLIASTLYMALKYHGVGRSFKEVARIFDIKVTTMTRGCKRFQAIMNVNVSSTTPADFLQRFCCRLGLPPRVVAGCAATLREVQRHCIVSENAPPTICASVIYMVATELRCGVTKRQIGAASDISEVSITKCHKKLCEYRHYVEGALQTAAAAAAAAASAGACPPPQKALPVSNTRLSAAPPSGAGTPTPALA